MFDSAPNVKNLTGCRNRTRNLCLGQRFLAKERLLNKLASVETFSIHVSDITNHVAGRGLELMDYVEKAQVYCACSSASISYFGDHG